MLILEEKDANCHDQTYQTYPVHHTMLSRPVANNVKTTWLIEMLPTNEGVIVVKTETAMQLTRRDDDNGDNNDAEDEEDDKYWDDDSTPVLPISIFDSQLLSPDIATALPLFTVQGRIQDVLMTCRRM